MPKLLIINITCNQGSTGKISEQVGLMMKERGWDVYYAHGARRVNHSKLKTIPFSSVKGEYLHALKSLLLDDDGLGSTRATKELVEKIKEIRPDVIQLHNLHGYYLNYKVLFEYLHTTNIPVVMTLHDCWSFTGHCVHFVTANCNKWKTGCCKCPIYNQAPKKSFIDRSSRNYQLKNNLIASYKHLTIVPVSEWLGGLVEQSIYKEHPIKVIQNGIDLSVFKPQKKEEGKFRILGVANPWSKDKGLYDVYKLRELLPLDEYEITLVGLSEKQVGELPVGIKGIVRTSNQQELAELYAMSNVLINPTYADTFPTINLEAMACGTPVITYRTGGSPESLTPETGVVVGVGDVKAMVDAIMQMKEAPLSTEKCRKQAEERFDKDSRFEDYHNLYSELLGGGNFLIYMAVASYWTKDKGIYDYIKLSELLSENERIVLVGYDSHKNKYNLPDNIITIPATKSQEELAFLYGYADVVLSLSYAETFGLTIAEAAACGTPAVVYDNSALPDLITEETGLVVPTGDVTAVYQALNLIKETGGKATYTKSCYNRAISEYDKNKCFEKYVELYEELVRS